MTTFLLIRHGETDSVGHTLAGRMTGVHLNGNGRIQARKLSAHLAAVRIAAVYASPLERTLETAKPIAATHGLDVSEDPAFLEVNTGEWTAQAFSVLETREDWRLFNRFRSTYPIPGGESMTEVQARALRSITALAAKHDGGVVAIVTHADVIRAILTHFLGMPLDHLLRIRVEPGSITTVHLTIDWVEVAAVNERP